uniref:Uncharacterized protein n=1 Tax=Oryza rufipogon TaxID=4529 RepID=A0A0E0N3M7_ORYRU
MAVDEMVGGGVGRWIHEKTTAAAGTVSAGRWCRTMAPGEGCGAASSTTTKRRWVAGKRETSCSAAKPRRPTPNDDASDASVHKVTQKYIVHQCFKDSYARSAGGSVGQN